MDAIGLTQQLLALWGLVRRFQMLLVGCVALFGLGGVGMALMTPKVYQAHQPFLIREETSSQLQSGRFQSLEWLKSAQETVQEVCNNPTVLRQALTQVGPTGWFADTTDYPSESDIENFQGDVWISAASGNELGRSEIIHLNVRAQTRERALRLAQVISQGVTQQLRVIRTNRALSIEQEMSAAVQIAQRRLDDVTRELVEMETSLGEDLIELRGMLDEKSSSESALLRPFLQQVDQTLLTNHNQLLQIEQEIKFFQNAQEDVSHLLGLPNDLLEQYQSLRELKLSLIAAQVNLSQVAAKYRSGHPRYVEAETRLDLLKKQIYRELSVSVENAKTRLVFMESRIQSLTAQRDQRISQLKRLAELRVPYQNLTAAQIAASTELKQAQADLSQAQAARIAASETDLLTATEPARVGTQSIGVSRSLIAVGAAGCGLLVGLGLMMFLAGQPPLASNTALARWSDRAA